MTFRDKFYLCACVVVWAAFVGIMFFWFLPSVLQDLNLNYF